MKFDYMSIFEAVWQVVEPMLDGVANEGKELAKAEIASFSTRCAHYLSQFVDGKPLSLAESKLWLQDELDHARGVLRTISMLAEITVEQIADQQGKVILTILEALPHAVGL